MAGLFYWDCLQQIHDKNSGAILNESLYGTVCTLYAANLLNSPIFTIFYLSSVANKFFDLRKITSNNHSIANIT